MSNTQNDLIEYKKTISFPSKWVEVESRQVHVIGFRKIHIK